jgi:hypothetical protein
MTEDTIENLNCEILIQTSKLTKQKGKCKNFVQMKKNELNTLRSFRIS